MRLDAVEVTDGVVAKLAVLLEAQGHHLLAERIGMAVDAIRVNLLLSASEQQIVCRVLGDRDAPDGLNELRGALRAVAPA